MHINCFFFIQSLEAKAKGTKSKQLQLRKHEHDELKNKFFMG
jgi:hypothetical protein